MFLLSGARSGIVFHPVSASKSRSGGTLRSWSGSRSWTWSRSRAEARTGHKVMSWSRAESGQTFRSDEVLRT